ncbi:MAG: hypothetical protein SFT93_05495 [Rickettsiaceae bacterium]|nr:hypothetical protein [Rickettsiaceae bacterium]
MRKNQKSKSNVSSSSPKGVASQQDVAERVFTTPKKPAGTSDVTTLGQKSNRAGSDSDRENAIIVLNKTPRIDRDGTAQSQINEEISSEEKRVSSELNPIANSFHPANESTKANKIGDHPEEKTNENVHGISEEDSERSLLRGQGLVVATHVEVASENSKLSAVNNEVVDNKVNLTFALPSQLTESTQEFDDEGIPIVDKASGYTTETDENRTTPVLDVSVTLNTVNAVSARALDPTNQTDHVPSEQTAVEPPVPVKEDETVDTQLDVNNPKVFEGQNNTLIDSIKDKAAVSQLNVSDEQSSKRNEADLSNETLHAEAFGGNDTKTYNVDLPYPAENDTNINVPNIPESDNLAFTLNVLTGVVTGGSTDQDPLSDPQVEETNSTAGSDGIDYDLNTEAHHKAGSFALQQKIYANVSLYYIIPAIVAGIAVTAGLVYSFYDSIISSIVGIFHSKPNLEIESVPQLELSHQDEKSDAISIEKEDFILIGEDGSTA